MTTILTTKTTEATSTGSDDISSSARMIPDHRIAELLSTIQVLQHEKQQSDQSKDARMEQLTSWCCQLSAVNQSLLQDKAGMLVQAKQMTDWCQQLVHTNQVWQQRARVGEALLLRSGMTQQQQQQQQQQQPDEETKNLLRQKALLIHYISEQRSQLNELAQANAQLVMVNRQLQEKLTLQSDFCANK
jgi:hypothetical protein